MQLIALDQIRTDQNVRELADEDQPSSDQASDLTELVYEEESEDEVNKMLAALERAEARLATGTYGRSIKSGQAIPDERLEANPLAELTVERVEIAFDDRADVGIEHRRCDPRILADRRQDLAR